MKKINVIFSIITAFSLVNVSAVYAGDETRENVTAGVYYNEDGELVGVKNFTGVLSENELDILLNISKPETAAAAKTYSFDSRLGYTANNLVELKDHDITVLNTGDLHGNVVPEDNIIGMNEIAGLKALTPNSLLFDAGDATQGVYYAALTRGEDVVITMNAAGYDGMVLGNHEFDYGFETLRTNVSLADFPVMAANVSLPQREDSRNIAISANNLYEVNGHKVGVFGLTTSNAKARTNPEGLRDVEFLDEIKTAKEQVEYLKNEGADIIIALVHLGTDTDAPATSSDLAKAMEGSGLDIIIDGQGKYPVCFTESGISIIYAGSNSEYTGNIGIDITSDGNVSVTPTLLGKSFFNNISPDRYTSNVITAAAEEQNQLLDKVVSHSGTTLWGGKVNGIVEGRVHETNLGDYICDRMIEKVKNNLDGSQINTPIVAIENGGGIRASIPMGDVTWRDIINVLPFSNTIKYKQVSPKIIYDVLEASVKSVTSQDKLTGQLNAESDGSFLQIGGMSFEYDPNGSAGSKVKAVYLDGSDKALDRNDTSTEIILVSNDYIIDGGDSFDMLTNLPQMGECGGLAEMLSDSLQKYDSQNPLTYPVTQNRIRTAGSYRPASYTASIYITDKNNGFMYDTDITYYIDGAEKKGRTNSSGILEVTVADGPHAVSLDNKTQVYVNNYSGAGIDFSTELPKLRLNN